MAGNRLMDAIAGLPQTEGQNALAAYLGFTPRRSVIDAETGRPMVTSAPTGEVRQRSNLLPLARDDNGAMTLAYPQAFFDAIDAGRFPGQALRGEKAVFGPDGHPTDEAMGAAGGIAGLAMTGSLPFSAPQGALRMFGGRNAATADHAALAKAEEMLGAGADRGHVWDQTGWFKGADGQMRFEIPDDAAFMKGVGPASDIARTRSAAMGRPGEATIGDVTYHPDLFKAYPEEASTKFSGFGNSTTERGRYAPADPLYDDGLPSISINNALPKGEARSTLLHELQHSIQDREGFSSGSSPALAGEFIDKAKLARDALSWRKELDTLPPEMDHLAKHNAMVETYQQMGMADGIPSLKAFRLSRLPIDELEKMAAPAMERVDPKPQDIYRRQAGEVEARNVQARRDLTPAQRRAQPPWMTQDVADADQIVNMLLRASGR